MSYRTVYIDGQAVASSVYAANLLAHPMVRWAQALNTIDATAPTVLSFSPADSASGVGIASNIVLTFSEPVQRGSGQIYIRTESATGAILASFNAASSGDLSISDHILTINPSLALATGTRYFVTFDAGSIQDMAGNPYAGTSTYDFTTAGVQDTTAPTVLSFNPLPTSTGVPPDSPIVLTFSELVQRGSGSITLYIALPQGGGAEVESFDVNTSPGLTFLGNTLTITPSANFLTRNYYYLTFDAGSIEDVAGNAYAGSSSYRFYTTTQSDFVAPNIAIFSPPDGATGVSLGTNIRLTFDEAIQKGMGVIQIRVGSATGTVLETFDVATSGSVGVSGNVLTLNPGTALAAGTRYFVTLARGSIKDADGNAYAGSNTYDFTTAGMLDNVAPAVTAFSPADGASGVAASSPITLTFSESVQRGSGLLQIRLDSATGTVVESMEAATSNRLSFAGNTLTITPSATLASGGKYFVTVVSGAIKDMAGNVYAGTTAYDFTVADTTAPTVTTFTPADGANGVVVSANIVLTFNELIQKGTGNIEIRLDSATGTVVETLNIATSRGLNLVGNSLTINPSADLLAGRHYFVTLASGTVKDMMGNAHIGTTTYDFTTADTTAPTVTTFSPADGASAVAPGSPIVLTFNEPVQKGTGSIEIRTGSATGPVVETLDVATSSHLTIVGNQLTITPATALLTDTRYFITMASGVIKDTIGNAYVGTNTYDFATADTTAPTVTAFSPTDGAAGVNGTANLVLTFSEPVDKGTGSIQIRSGSGTGAVIETLDVATSSKLTINGNQLTIDPTVTLDNNARYFVTIPSGAVKDMAGNAYRGTSSYNFGTVDTIAPTVVKFSPTDAATGVALNSNIVFSFTELIERGVGSLVLKTAAGAVVETFDAATSASLNIAGNILTINPTVDLQPSTQYVLTAASGTVKDRAGNAYTGISGYDFTTVDTTAPIVTAFAPLDGATGVALGSTIVLTFNEAVQRGSGNIEIRAGSHTGTLVESFNVATSTNLRLSGNTLTLNPSADLEADTSYFVVLPAQTVKDLAGNPYAGTSRYDFTTARSHPALHNTPSNDQFTGTVGIDTVEYAGLSSRYQLQHNATTNGWVVTGEGNDRLQSIERLQFADKKIALDLAPSDHAGQALLFWGVLNYNSINSPLQFGSVLQQFDAGQTMQEAFELAINKGTVELLAGSNSNEALARLAFRNVTGGREPGSAMVDVLVSFMDGRAAHYSQAQFLAVVAQLDSNLLHVGLTGLQQTGVEYL